MDAPSVDAALPFLAVRDLAATRDFYERDLGLRLARDQGSCLIFAAGTAYLGFCASEAHDGGAAAAGDGLILTFVSDEVEAWHRRLRGLGVEIEGPPRHDERFGILHFFARDPDGYRIEFQRFGEPLR